MSLVLASTSPRRRELLGLLQVPFTIAAPTGTESTTAGALLPQQVTDHAEAKARSCSRTAPAALVLGSDTLIGLDGEPLGKPADADQARATLRKLRGRAHDVLTAVALLRETDGFRAVGVETVRVWMRAFTEEELERYVASGEGLDKAGAYAIQGGGGRLIERIEGDFTATVGLPLRQVAGLLLRAGLTVPVDVDRLYRLKPYPNWARFG